MQNQIKSDTKEPLPDALMKLIKLDKEYFRAEGNYLYFRDGDSVRKVIDFAGGYGSLILGHNHPELTLYAQELLGNSVPFHAQLSNRKLSAELAGLISEKISQAAGREYEVLLANTGAEAVEAAIKHLCLAYSVKINHHLESITRSLNKIFLTRPGTGSDSKVFTVRQRPLNFREFKLYVTRLNLAMLQRHRPAIIAPVNSFHGKTMGALYVTYYSPFKEASLPPELLKNNFFGHDTASIDRFIRDSIFNLFIPRQDADGRIILEEYPLSSIAGIIIEPILGEGGIVRMPDNLLKHLHTIAGQHNIPLVFDEIQCGMYRTGEFLASTAGGALADYYLLGKSLGGGIAKISALAVERSKYIGEFRLVQTSTFAEDDFSSAIAIKALELAEKHAGNVEHAGRELFMALESLANRFPRAIQEIRGKGLMAGITFRNFNDSGSGLLQSFSRSPYFGYLLCGYLLNRHDLRLAPTLSDPHTLRVEPSLFITPADINCLKSGLEKLCHILEWEDVYSLVEYTLDLKYMHLRAPADFKMAPAHHQNKTRCPKVGFLVHYIDTETMKSCEPSMGILPGEALEEWLWKFLPVSEPVILGQQIIRDSKGEKVHITFSGLGFTSNMAKIALEEGSPVLFAELIEKAVRLLKKDFHVGLVGLGQFTSILTMGGLYLKETGVNFTTGNSYTVSTAIGSILAELQQRKREPDDIRAAVIGAAGNIASIYAQCILRHVGRIVLLGSDSPSGLRRTTETARECLYVLVNRLFEKIPEHPGPSEKQILSGRLFARINAERIMPGKEQLWEEYLREYVSDPPIRIISSIDDIKPCNLVIVATNQGKPFLEPGHFTPGTLICDISVPTACTTGLINNDRDIRIIFGGLAELPCHEKLEVRGLPLEQGYSYGCIAETLILGLEKWKDHFSFGPVSPAQVEMIEEMASRHGFCHVKPRTSSLIK